MDVTALVDRFGSNRINAARPAELFAACKPKITCIAVPFVGGFSEVGHFSANIISVNDKDAHVLNLAKIVRTDCDRLVAELEATPYHPNVLAAAQEFCRALDLPPDPRFRNFDSLFDHVAPDPFQWAYYYFICSWMGRGGKGGTVGEFKQGLSVRWKSTGGDSVVRFRNATQSLKEWQKIMQQCTFHVMDAFDFLAECQERDVPENGIYCDPPWVDLGDKYVHAFGKADHQRLRDVLECFQKSRVIVRYGDHPLVRQLYEDWRWHMLSGRTQANDEQAELLLTNW